MITRLEANWSRTRWRSTARPTASMWFERTPSALMLADWAALYTAEYYGNESEEVPMIEEFKKLI